MKLTIPIGPFLPEITCCFVSYCSGMDSTSIPDHCNVIPSGRNRQIVSFQKNWMVLTLESVHWKWRHCSIKLFFRWDESFLFYVDPDRDRFIGKPLTKKWINISAYVICWLSSEWLGSLGLWFRRFKWYFWGYQVVQLYLKQIRKTGWCNLQN